MGTARPETLLMREARAAAKADGLRVTLRIAGVEVTLEPVDPTAKPPAQSGWEEQAWDKATGVAP